MEEALRSAATVAAEARAGLQCLEEPFTGHGNAAEGQRRQEPLPPGQTRRRLARQPLDGPRQAANEQPVDVGKACQADRSFQGRAP